ncbi:MAG: transposase [Chloroflexi bacterium]|nr:transposase [Chloroflexota bacterium]
MSQSKRPARDKRRGHAMERYVTGLLTDHPNKNCDTLADVLPGTTEQRLQALLTTMAWDETDANRKRVAVMTRLKTEGDGVLIIDPTDFPKQGQHSVGVARQYSGSLGKGANCQVTVNCHYAERTIARPVVSWLYLPEAWANDAARRKRAHVPTDAEFGDNPLFLDGLEARRERYVVDVRRDFQVSRGHAPHAEVWRAEDVAARLPSNAWRVIRWQEGTPGWLTGSFAAVRCWRVDGRGKRTIGWLIAERELPDGSGRNKLHWSNFPARTPCERMVELVHRRVFIEQYHEETKTLLGWAQFQAPARCTGRGVGHLAQAGAFARQCGLLPTLAGHQPLQHGSPAALGAATHPPPGRNQAGHLAQATDPGAHLRRVG